MSDSSVPSSGRSDARRQRLRVRRGAKALVRSADRVLLVRERHADGGTFWTLPGGGARPGESLADALRRELTEEIRCEAVVEGERASVWYAHRSSAATLSRYTVFACSLTAGADPVRREHVVETAWVNPSEPPAGTLLWVRSVLADAAP